MSDTNHSFEKLREGYLGLDPKDRILFWIHFAVALPIMMGAVVWAFGIGPVSLFALGYLLWIGSNA